jgi:hypothetical protein
MIQYYTYIYSRKCNSDWPAGSPYYVGKGHAYRVFDRNHGIQVPKDKSRIQIILARDEQSALESEKARIRTPEEIQRSTEALIARIKGVPKTPEHRAKISAANKGIVPSALCKQRQKEAMHSKVYTEEERQKMSERMKKVRATRSWGTRRKVVQGGV